MSVEQVHKYISEKQNHLLSGELKKSPQLVLKIDSDGRNPLMWALSEGQDPETVSIVLKAARSCSKFDIDAADEAGFTALHVAASLGVDYIQQVLDFNPSIDSRTNNMQTPLFLAVSKKNIEAVNLLIEHGASVRSKDKRQVTILQRAVGVGSLDIVEILLKHQAPINATDIYGWTALHYAFAEGRTEIIKYLLDHGADPEIKSRDGELPSYVGPTGYRYK